MLDEESHTGAVARFHSYHVMLFIIILCVWADEKLLSVPTNKALHLSLSATYGVKLRHRTNTHHQPMVHLVNFVMHSLVR